jgi:hypothetical protein
MTAISEIVPKSIVKHFACKLLHEKIAVMDNDLKIYYICKEGCDYDNDTTKD